MISKPDLWCRFCKTPFMTLQQQLSIQTFKVAGGEVPDKPDKDPATNKKKKGNKAKRLAAEAEAAKEKQKTAAGRTAKKEES